MRKGDKVDHVNLTLKSLSATRWLCRWEAVRAVVEQITRIVQALITCSDDRDPKTYTDSNAFLNSICAFDFVFGLLLLKVVLSNTDSLSKYLQSKNMDVATAKKTANSKIKTLEGCRDEKCFQMLWVRAQVMANGIKKEIQGTRFLFKDATAPRNKAPSRRLPALIGESSTTTQHQQRTAESHYRVKTFYPTLDKVILEMRTRF